MTLSVLLFAIKNEFKVNFVVQNGNLEVHDFGVKKNEDPLNFDAEELEFTDIEPTRQVVTRRVVQMPPVPVSDTAEDEEIEFMPKRHPKSHHHHHHRKHHQIPKLSFNDDDGVVFDSEPTAKTSDNIEFDFVVDPVVSRPKLTHRKSMAHKRNGIFRHLSFLTNK